MRDAFGGAFMIRIFLIFILVYILFTAVALNYAKAFKVKDLVIAYLEDNEITDLEHLSADGYRAMSEYFEKEIVGSYQYTHAMNSIKCSERNEYCFQPGIKIEQINPNSNETNRLGVYYKVTTYFGFDIGFLRLFKAADNSDVDNTNDFGTWEISGETRLIVGE